MATSGSVNFNQTRNEIITDALQLIGIYGVGRTVSAEDMTFANNLLNKMVKAWQAQEIHLWTKEEGVLFIADNTGEYTLSNESSAAKATKADDAVITELNGAALVSATSLTVDSTAGMAANDNIGIVLDDDTVHWTTIVSVDSSTTLTIDDGLASAAADNNNVYTFTNRINKPLKIHSIRRVTGIDSGSTTTQTEIPMQMISHSDYFDLPTKSHNGLSSHFYYNPDISNGKVYLWPRPNDPEMYFRFTYTRQLEDFDSASDNADFPSEWLECLTYQLAVRLAPAFGKDQKAIAAIAPLASTMLKNMLDYDRELSSVYIQPDV